VPTLSSLFGASMLNMTVTDQLKNLEKVIFQNRIGFIETSAMDGTNVDEAFFTLARKAIALKAVKQMKIILKVK
jgi:hypothetical protein